MLIKHFLLIIGLCIAIPLASAQYKIHSHNDYAQKVPFWSAYANGLNSIEVDVFLKNDILFATHGEAEIVTDRTIESLYLKPLLNVISMNLGEQQKLQLLIDIKSEPYSTLKALMDVLNKYPDIIDNENITIAISGYRPKEAEYSTYPDYIKFDYQSLDDVKDQNSWDKVALISQNFRNFSSWNGKGRLTAEDYKKVKTAIDKAHSFNKPFRFWAAPDSKTAWKALRDLGVDFINTDLPYESARYLNSLEDRVYYNKTFSEVYRPNFASDQKKIPVKNIILLIGDGNGLTQISSSVLANGGNLNLTQLKSIGFLKTQSADDFTTDSAAAGTALATGAKTNNRAIGVDASGQSLVNITELLSDHGFVTGCITTDKITGATPASFYAHQKDRSEILNIAADLTNSKLSLFIGGGSKDFQNNWEATGFSILESLDAIGQNKKEKVGYFISERQVPSVLDGRGNVLYKAAKNGMEFLHAKNKPFFLMIEGAQIDSYGHENKVSGIVSEGIDFDMAVAEAIKFADDNQNTLVIITADHETSGFSIPQGSLESKMIEGDFTTHDHTATMVPIFAYGPHSQEFQGVYENSDLFIKILKVLGLEGPSILPK